MSASPEGLDFHYDWFSPHIPMWRGLFARTSPKPRKVLEIGAFEGCATCHMLEHILDPASPGEVHCVDTWAGGVEHAAIAMDDVLARFNANTAIVLARGPGHRVVAHRMPSNEALLALLAAGHGGSFDLVYVDGSHQAPDVLEDLVLSFRLCRTGGLMICDDYIWHRQAPGREDILDTPKLAIDAFTSIYRRRLRIIPWNTIRQVAFTKT